MARLSIEVVYATVQCQEVVSVSLEEGARAIDAVRASGMADRHPEIDATALVLGVFGRVLPPQALLQDGDRVEIYRPLIADPKEARRARAAPRRRKR